MLKKLNIIFEDENLRVVTKPPCIHTTSNRGGSLASLEQLLKEEFQAEKFVQSGKFEAGIVHRLDFETSGIVLAAKNEESWNYLRSLFKEGRITKKYLAIIEGDAPAARNLDHWIGGRYRHSKKVTIYEEAIPRSQEAHAVLKKISFDEKKISSKVEINLITGARHQIRAQCAFIGHPLVGDALYGSSRKTAEDDRPFFLHSWKTSFLGQNGESFSFEAPIGDLFSLPL
jgi:23S rRNA pseudouridine1911/1915/1917 synthase